jgi:hypothetical protein
MHRPQLLLLLLCVAACGCTVAQDARRTVFLEPGLFNWKSDLERSRELYRRWAERAWSELGEAEATCGSSTYKWGFLDGFTEYVFAGGTGEPPAMPPRELWNLGWRTTRPEAADEWFAGFRHGAHVAREGGYRQRAVVRSALSRGGDLVPAGAMYGSRCDSHGEPFQSGHAPSAETIDTPPSAPAANSTPQMAAPHLRDAERELTLPLPRAASAESKPGEPAAGELDIESPAVRDAPSTPPNSAPTQPDAGEAIPDLEDLLHSNRVELDQGTHASRRAIGEAPAEFSGGKGNRRTLADDAAVARRPRHGASVPSIASQPATNPFRAKQDGWRAPAPRPFLAH